MLSKDIMLSSAGPLGAVTVVGDFVLFGAALWSPTLPDQLQANGWGPVRFHAGVGDKAGPPGVPPPLDGGSKRGGVRAGMLRTSS